MERRSKIERLQETVFDLELQIKVSMQHSPIDNFSAANHAFGRALNIYRGYK